MSTPVKVTETAVSIQPKSRRGKRGKSAAPKVAFWAPDCRYEVILDNVRNIGWKLVSDEKFETRANIFWVDVATIGERFKMVQPWQSVNHFPGMPNIARKNKMGQNLNKMLKIFPKEYAFYPRTWVLPSELNDFRSNFDAQGNSIGNKIYIIKPDSGCQGRGIFLTKTWDTVPKEEAVVAQLYIKKPLLLDNFKFDLRLYCLVTSVKPLRMYLFQDGLVRMCTEEYVKPTKQNISNVCMHLTNYAVNKHNSNFVQPTAASSEDCQDEGSKRSLSWFMNWTREQYGDSKADWLWKRMGTLCVRTVLSILPILSREYDQHFKSFNNVPVDLSGLQMPLGNGGSGISGTAPKKEGNSGVDDLKVSGGNAIEKNDLNGGVATMGTGDDNENDDGDDTVEEGDDVDAVSSELPNENGSSIADGGSSNKNSSSSSSSNDDKRGCRCFEILGFDIMVDAYLKPWLIEVNHLPSFGTDSPLDLDIKDRLMQQVFQTLNVLPDDESAYNLYHKSEAAKRLMKSTKADREKEEKKRLELELEKQKNKKLANRRPSQQPQQQASTETDDLLILPDEPIFDPALFEEPIDDGPCAPERFEEIKQILIEIYQEFSPEKISKIDRLLSKYKDREEEFLRFVYHKYNVTPPWIAAAEEAERRRVQWLIDVTLARERHQQQKQGAEGDGESTNAAMSKRGDVNRSTSSLAPRPPNNNRENINNPNSNRESRSTSMKHRSLARSLSPPPTSNRRAPAIWKGSDLDDTVYRNEIMEAHYPKKDDEIIAKEMSMLVQFTRIFPPEDNGLDERGEQEEDIKAEEDGEKEEVNGEKEDEDEEGNNSSGNTKQQREKDKDGVLVKPDGTKYKYATYEDIIYQSFLQDRRQTMRMFQPLISRSRPVSDGPDNSLPLIENKAHMHGSIAANVGRGVVGWRAPPPKQETKVATRMPTQEQMDAAKRLSQGLSVTKSSSSRQRYGAANNSSQPLGSNSHGLIMLDPSSENSPMSSGGGDAGFNNLAYQQLLQHQMQQQQQQMLQQHQQQLLIQQQQQQQQQQLQQPYNQYAPLPSSSLSAGVGHLSASNSVAGGHLQQNYGSASGQVGGVNSQAVAAEYWQPPVRGGLRMQQQHYLLQQQQQIHPQQQQQQHLTAEETKMRQRYEAAKATPASVLRQQLFRFDSHLDPGMQGIDFKVEGYTPRVAGLGPNSQTGGPLSGAGAAVMGMQAGSLLNGSYPYKGQQSSGAAPGSQGSNAQPSLPGRVGSQSQLLKNASASFGVKLNTDETVSEEMLRQLFPGWF